MGELSIFETNKVSIGSVNADVTLPTWQFGQPTLQWLKNNGTESNGRAKWTKGEWDRYGQWTAKLSPGYQTDDDYGSVSFIVNNMPLVDLESIEYIYRMDAEEVVAPNISIHVFDPTDTDNRADITYSHGAVALTKTIGWGKFELLPASNAELFYYSDNLSGSGTTGLDGTEGSATYTLAQYQSDVVFSAFVIGKITIEYGYYSTGYLSPAHICKIAVNDVDIPLEPSPEEQLDIARDDLANAQRVIPTWTFGKPSLQWLNKGSAKWAKEHMIFSGWTAKLSGGYQSGWDDWARVSFNVNSMPLTDLESIMYAYRMTVTETVGPNISFDVHNPAIPNQWAEISYSNGAILPKTSGWNYFELLPATAAALFWFGDNIDTSGITGNDGSTMETLATYQADAFFSTAVITKINIEWGYHSTGFLEPVYVGKIEVNGTDITLEPSAEEQLDLMRDDQAKALTTIPTWTFGEPVLRMGGRGRVGWVKDTGNAEALHQKSTSGYLANLYGGGQTGGNNWGAVYVPVNELPVPDFTEALWTYRMEETEIYGVNMVIWVHDPTDNDKRAEITQGGSVAGLAHNDGWNAHELNTATSQFFAFGEGTSGTALSGTNTWAAFQTDVIFSTWTIYRISFEMGWYSAGTFADVWLADVKLNGQVIPLLPCDGEVIGRETKSVYVATDTTSTTVVTAISPAATKRVRILNVFAATANASAALFEVYFGAGANITTDATKAIFMAELDLGVNDWAGMSYGDNGPLGGIDEDVSIRADTDIDADGKFVIVYREE